VVALERGAERLVIDGDGLPLCGELRTRRALSACARICCSWMTEGVEAGAALFFFLLGLDGLGLARATASRPP